jgi:hypothetical protein
MRRVLWVVLPVAGVFAVVLGLLFSPWWSFVWDGTGYIPRGIYRCAPFKTARSSGRDCIAGADQLLFREEKFADGSARRSWYAGGALEYRREQVSNSGEVTSLTRQLADCWASSSDQPSPEGKAGLVCPAPQ